MQDSRGRHELRSADGRLLNWWDESPGASGTAQLDTEDSDSSLDGMFWYTAEFRARQAGYPNLEVAARQLDCSLIRAAVKVAPAKRARVVPLPESVRQLDELDEILAEANEAA